MKIRSRLLGIVFSMMFSVHATATQPPVEDPSVDKPDINTKWQIWLGMGLPEPGSPAALAEDKLQNDITRILTFNFSKSNKIRLCDTMSEPKCVTYLDLAIKVKNRCHKGTDAQVCRAAIEEADAFYTQHTDPAALAASAAGKDLARSRRGENTKKGSRDVSVKKLTKPLPPKPGETTGWVRAKRPPTENK